MKELEQIKSVEEDVSKEVERATKKAEKIISDASSEKEIIIEKTVKLAESKKETMVEKAKQNAEKEKEAIIKDSEKQVKDIEAKGKQNFSKAVDMLLKKLNG